MKTLRAFLAILVVGSLVSVASAGWGDALQNLGSRALEKTTDESAKKGFTGLTIQEEIDLGDSVSVEIVGRYGGAWKDTVATQRVNLVGRTLARYAKRDSIDWRFGLLNSDAINAFSAPNGRVFITRGLYRLLKDDDELAGVLAHEISHTDLRHAAEIIEKKQRTAATTDVVTGAARDTYGSKLEELPVPTQLLEGYAKNVLTTLFTEGYPKGLEFEADQAGYALAQVCGFDPNGLRVALQKVDANTAKAKETFNTHPKTGDRLKKLPGGEKKKGKS